MEKINTKEAINRISEKMEADAHNYRNAIEQGAIVEITETVDDGVVVVRIEKKCKS